MAKFGKTSKARLATVAPELQEVLKEAIKYYDFSIVCGHRNREEQDKAFNEGFSLVRFPNSKHNSLPSTAVDIIPYLTKYTDEDEFYKMATYMFKAAMNQGVSIKWGGHWSFRDLPHFQLTEGK